MVIRRSENSRGFPVFDFVLYTKIENSEISESALLLQILTVVVT